MISMTSLETVEIIGRGLVYIVISPAGEKRPCPGESILLDGKRAVVRGVERHPLPEDINREEKLGLMVRWLDEKEDDNA